MTRRTSSCTAACLVSALALCLLPRPASALDVVRNGRPAATIVIKSVGTPVSGKQKRAGKQPGQSPDERAAGVLAEWVTKMTGATLPVAAEPAPDTTPIYIGAAAIEAGLKVDDIDSPTSEGLRVLCDGQRVLLAGQDDKSTIKAACRLLEQWGCRYYMDHPLGEVYPQRRTLSVDKLDIREKPAVAQRRIWGSQWSNDSVWKIWNGEGGVEFNTQHAWGHYIPKDLFTSHPEYFRMRGGRREPSEWYCTSNRQLRGLFADSVIKTIQGGLQHPSISPPDGRGYCECEACRAQDDPKSLEPSSLTVSVTNRYADFFQDVAQRVGKACPDSILNFYSYADYTQAPTSGIQFEPNLCAWIAPIRYCRFHRIGDPTCPSRLQLQELIDGWGACAQKVGYRTYNYNLAECTVPFSMVSVWKHDIPWLVQKGCIGINLETLANWQIYGPHIYLSIRLAYDPQADADAVMDEYYTAFYGLKAGPSMRQYWNDIDKAFAGMRTHSGSFSAVHRVYTTEFLGHLSGLLQRAGEAARGETTHALRVAFTAEGFRNAQQYIALRDALNRGDIPSAKRTYDELLARNEAGIGQGQGNHYTITYLKQFVGKHVDAAAAAVAPPNRLVQVLPDKWRLEYDEADKGLTLEYEKPDFDDKSWETVATFSDTLDAQGLPDRLTTLWYRVAVDVAQPTGNLALFFTQVDGDARVWVNGREIGASTKKTHPFQLPIGEALQRGRNVVAVRVDHSALTELFLGGIVRPVFLIDTADTRP